MPVLVDGNNVMHALPGSARGRASVRKLALDAARNHRTRITVVFDGPPPDGAPENEALGSVKVRYSLGRAADDLIVEMIPAGGAARQWTVATNDRELQRRVRGAGAVVQSAGDWIAACRRRDEGSDKPEELSPDEVEDWAAYFASGSDADD